jgi:rhodanese-related sulfurtransferase
MARTLKGVDAHGAARLMKDGALMVDVREPGEYAGGHIPGSENVALSRFDLAPLPLGEGQAVVFFCASGGRTTLNAARLAAKAGDAEAYVMQGGISAWGRAGLPVESRSEAESGERRGFFSRMFG